MPTAEDSARRAALIPIGDHSDCPGEYSLTQHLVLAPDIRFQTINATHFSGTQGLV
ncbi:MAG TPA: hypothetical protein VFT30_11050 [Nitrospira sp.]|nr:hypothetical protein [Nitrospira sp.]